MAEREGFGGGFGRGGRGGRGRGGPQRARRIGGDEAKVWTPCTNLGRLVKANAITNIDEIFLHNLPVREPQIIDHFFRTPAVPNAAIQPEEERKGLPILQDEVMGISPVQKQSSSGQRTRFKVFVIVGDSNGHIGFGQKCAKEVATAIKGAINAAKLALGPVRRGYWGNKIGLPHTVPMKVSAKCGSVRVRLIPAPRGSGVVGSPITKKVLMFAGVSDCFTSSCGHTRTTGNFVKAVVYALLRTYGYITPDLWRETKFPKTPFEKHAAFLDKATSGATGGAIVDKPVAATATLGSEEAPMTAE